MRRSRRELEAIREALRAELEALRLELAAALDRADRASASWADARREADSLAEGLATGLREAEAIREAHRAELEGLRLELAAARRSLDKWRALAVNQQEHLDRAAARPACPNPGAHRPRALRRASLE